MKVIILISILFFSIISFSETLPNWAPENKLSYVYLTWEHEDTSNHMTVNYHSSLNYEIAQVLYSTKPQYGVVSNYEFKKFGETKWLDGLVRAFHNITITDLKPDTTYYFVVGDMKTGFSKEHKFRTLPADSSRVRFVTGGDMGHADSLADMLKVAAKTDPHFAAIGGDISYANGKIKNFNRWDKWFKMWTENMVTSENYLIPMVLALGNHEVNIFANDPEGKAPFYFTLFKQTPTPSSYFHKRFGDHTIIYFLDTGHISYYGGAQKKWMERTMKKYKHIKNQFSVYHIGLYPSHRKYKGIQHALARSNWIKLFDKYEIDLAFENHDHTFKVTHPLKDGKIVRKGDGRIYLGDGCWGKTPRKAHPNRWYLKEAIAIPHVWNVTASGYRYTYEAIDEDSQSFYSGRE